MNIWFRTCIQAHVVRSDLQVHLQRAAGQHHPSSFH